MLAIAAGVAVAPRGADANCNLIPAAQREFRSTAGTVDRTLVAPGLRVAVRVAVRVGVHVGVDAAGTVGVRVAVAVAATVGLPAACVAVTVGVPTTLTASTLSALILGASLRVTNSTSTRPSVTSVWYT